jgi:hypothetical protein
MNLNDRECQYITRAFKQHQREAEGWSSFEPVSGDLLAFCRWREALETKDEKHKKFILLKAMKFAVTEKARRILLTTENEASEIISSPICSPKIDIHTLERDDPGIRPIPLIGNFGDITPKRLRLDRKIEKKQPLGLVQVAGIDTLVILRLNEPLKNARKPFAIVVEDCSRTPDLTRALGQSKLKSIEGFNCGPILVILEGEVHDKSDSRLYLVSDLETEKLEIMPLSKVKKNKNNIEGEILYCCLPNDISN